MTTEKAINILREMQLWRRGQGVYDTDEPTRMPYSPAEFGEAIDVAIAVLDKSK